ncbi:DUF1104 domain-containing protein [Poseidonibacter lekithochrous]|uniref:DUF1104 domain-containing protein n=1 Tax=Poseidonibacter lekithochrous TaxID=1904463 RepID=UPI0008FC994A|nr:DUF1104 domain-containing protein [Poseidonibacter lekithochrous]QKJ23364.1 hypothetical protein ALEK_2103 [Poseidonibacter lekithochrous]
MKKILLIISFALTLVFAKVDYSEMSTQELIAIMGYVEPQNKRDFIRELRSRVPTMSNAEKKRYQNNLKKLR